MVMKLTSWRTVWALLAKKTGGRRLRALTRDSWTSRRGRALAEVKTVLGLDGGGLFLSWGLPEPDAGAAGCGGVAWRRWPREGESAGATGRIRGRNEIELWRRRCCWKSAGSGGTVRGVGLFDGEKETWLLSGRLTGRRGKAQKKEAR